MCGFGEFLLVFESSCSCLHYLITFVSRLCCFCSYFVESSSGFSLFSYFFSGISFLGLCFWCWFKGRSFIIFPLWVFLVFFYNLHFLLNFVTGSLFLVFFYFIGVLKLPPLSYFLCGGFSGFLIESASSPEFRYWVSIFGAFYSIDGLKLPLLSQILCGFFLVFSYILHLLLFMVFFTPLVDKSFFLYPFSFVGFCFIALFPSSLF